MSDVDRLLREFIEAHRAGASPDPGDFLEQVEGTDRRELAALIDASSGERRAASGIPPPTESRARRRWPTASAARSRG